MSDLEVDTDELIATGHALRMVAGEFRGAERVVDDHRHAVGHRLLAQRLDESQGSWDDRRNDLLDDIDALAEVAAQLGEVFEEIEASLVAALHGRSR